MADPECLQDTEKGALTRFITPIDGKQSVRAPPTGRAIL